VRCSATLRLTGQASGFSQGQAQVTILPYVAFPVTVIDRNYYNDRYPKPLIISERL
jgi:hypothetical protein